MNTPGNADWMPDSEDPEKPMAQEMADGPSDAATCSQASFDEVWERLRPFMGSDYDTQNAIIVMDHFGWIDNGPCTCGLEIYGDPCPHHSRPENDSGETRQQPSATPPTPQSP